jgi:hypothetical protein
MTLAKLHDALQDAMGWTNSHLHCFEIAGRRIGMVGIEEDSPELEDERRVRVTSVLPTKGARLVYRYDYGDDWDGGHFDPGSFDANAVNRLLRVGR